MAEQAVLEAAETLQTAHINPNPDPKHDINPSTAASRKEAAEIVTESPPSDIDDLDDDEIPADVVRPIPRTRNLPPLPDLRFEQSYLASIQHAQSPWQVLYITVKDQVIWPFLQGAVWTLALSGWRYWNRASQFSGNTVGSRIRRWWWGVNNWELPADFLQDKKMARRVEEYYVDEFGSGGPD